MRRNRLLTLSFQGLSQNTLIPESAKDLMLVMKRRPDALAAIREVGASIAISLRPIAGNRFTKMVRLVLVKKLKPYGTGCVTSALIRQRASWNLVVRNPTSEQDLKPEPSRADS